MVRIVAAIIQFLMAVTTNM